MTSGQIISISDMQPDHPGSCDEPFCRGSVLMFLDFLVNINMANATNKQKLMADVANDSITQNIKSLDMQYIYAFHL